MPELALDDDQWNAFVSHLDRVRVAQLMRCEAPDSSHSRGVADLAASCGAGPPSSAGRAGDDAAHWSDRQLEPAGKPRLEFLPDSLVHADFATAPAYAASDEDRAAAFVEIGLGE